MLLNNLLGTIRLKPVEDPAWRWGGLPAIGLVAMCFTVRTRLVQLRHLPNMFRSITQRAQPDTSGRTRSRSAFPAFTVTAPARVGTGNIAGVSGAIPWVARARSSGCASPRGTRQPRGPHALPIPQ
jgi:alanine or glycine:cation symporter, AGCS family